MLGDGAGHVAVATDLGVGEEAAQLHEELVEAVHLLGGARVARTTLGVQAALVTDADAAAVPRDTVGSGLAQEAVLRHGAVPTDVEVVADGTEAARLVVTGQLLDGVGLVAPRGGTVDDEVLHGGEGGASLLLVLYLLDSHGDNHRAFSSF